MSRGIKEVHGKPPTLARMASAAVLAAAVSLSLAVPTDAVDVSGRSLPAMTVHDTPLTGSAGEDMPEYYAVADAVALPGESRHSHWVVGMRTGPVDEPRILRAHLLASETTPTPASPALEEPCEEIDGITCLSLGEGGIFEQSVTARSVDRQAKVLIPAGTRALTYEGVPLRWIKVGRLETSSPLPNNHTAVTRTYYFEPAGVIFDNPVVINLRYSDEDVWAGVKEERLFLAVWSPFTSEWVKVKSNVDVIDNAISTEATRLTAVVVLAATAPASFRLSRLTVVPEEVGLGEAVEVSALVENTGDLTDVLHVEFRKDGEVFDSNEVTLDGRSSITVSSEVISDEPGRYTVSINDLAANFTVREKESVVVTPAPLDDKRADIQFISLSITPVAAEVGQAVTIGVVAINNGDSEGTETVSLLINGKLADSELIDLAPGDRQVVSFVVTERAAGTYSVVVGGWGATFAVGDVVESFGVNWVLFGWIVGGVGAFAAVLVYLLWPKRREPRTTPGNDSEITSPDDPSARRQAEGGTR